MRAPIRRHLTHSMALCVAALIAGSALAAPKDDAAKSDCLQKALIQFNLDNAFCANYPLTSVLYGDCMTRSARAYGNAVVACAQDTPDRTYRPQLRNPGKLTIKQ